MKDRILSEVSLYTRIPISILMSKSRKFEIVSARALACKAMLKKGYTLSSIGRFFGHSDHTSAMNMRDKSYPDDVAIDLILERL